MSVWGEVTSLGTSELDLTSLARLEVEVPGEESPCAKLGLTVFPAGSSSARTPARQLVLQRRTDGTFRHVLRLPEGDWTVELRDEAGSPRTADVHMPAAGELQLKL